MTTDEIKVCLTFTLTKTDLKNAVDDLTDDQAAKIMKFITTELAQVGDHYDVTWSSAFTVPDALVKDLAEQCLLEADGSTHTNDPNTCLVCGAEDEEGARHRFCEGADEWFCPDHSTGQVCGTCQSCLDDAEE